MTAYEMAKKYYPRLWDRSRLEALVEAEKLTIEEMTRIVDEATE